LEFFERPEQARRTTRWLVLWYALAVVSVVASFCAAAAPLRPPPQVDMAIAAIVGGCILVVSAFVSHRRVTLRELVLLTLLRHWRRSR
jgi:hypothetical protein